MSFNPYVTAAYRSQRAASSAVKWVSPCSLGGSYECSARRHTLIRPCQQRVLIASVLSGVAGCCLRFRCHLTHTRGGGGTL